MDSDDKLFLKDISEKQDHIAANTIKPIEEIRKNFEEKIGPIHHAYPYTVEERLDMITEKLEEIGHDVFPNKNLYIHVNGFQRSLDERVPENLEERLDNLDATCDDIIRDNDKLYEKVKERIPEDLEERLDDLHDTGNHIFHQSIKANEYVQALQHSFQERVPLGLEERLDEIEFQLKSLTDLVRLFCDHFGVKKPAKKEQAEPL